MLHVPIEWLRKHVDVPTGLGAERLAADLVRVGLEEKCVIPPAVTGPLIVDKVLTREAREQSNGKVINYCRIDVGPEHNDAPGTSKEPSDLSSRGIACGAHSFDVEDYIVACLPGAVLPGDFRIATRKTYGHVSDDMICSARKLGIGEDYSGIIVLQQWLTEHGHDGEEPPVPRTDAINVLGLGEEVLEISVIPDRGYCFAMRDVARKYSHSTSAHLTDSVDTANTGLYPNGMADAGQGDYDIVVPGDPRPIHGRPECDRYVARLMYGIDPSIPSPAWMQDRLTAAGMRPISLTVDVTDYVMLDLGQSLHAFDAGKLTTPIVARQTRDGEHLTFFDEVTRSLNPENLIIADSPGGESSRTLVPAGVFGGALSEVDTGTCDVLTGAAHFDLVSVARSSRRHKLLTESSKRNKRGVDTELAPIAVRRAVNLLVEYSGGTTKPVATDINRTRTPESIIMRADTVRRLTNVAYGTGYVTELLTTIGCTVECGGSADDGTALLTVTPPTWRPDLVGPAHLAEEIAHLDRYDTISVIVSATPAGTGLDADQRARRDIVRALADAGLTQVPSYLFVGDIYDLLEIPANDARRQTVRLTDPLAGDAPYLRTSALDSLVDIARCNVSRGLTDVAVSGVGSVIHPAGTVPAPVPGTAGRPSQSEEAALEVGIPAQPTRVDAVMTGEHECSRTPGTSHPWDWADIVEVVRTVAAALRVVIEIRTPEYPYAPWYPDRTVEIRLPGRRQGKGIGPGRLVVHAGKLHPRVTRALGLSKRACAVEIGLDPPLGTARDTGAFQVKPVSTSPAARGDIALVVDETTTAAEVEALVRQAAGDLTEGVRPFDVFHGPQLGEGKKSLTFSLMLRVPDRILTAEETTGVRKRVVKRAAKLLRAELRS